MTTLSYRVVSVFNKKTSIRLANAEWYILDNICVRENIKRKRLLELIEQNRDPKLGLTASVRLFALLYLYTAKSKNDFMAQNSENIMSAINDMAHS